MSESTSDTGQLLESFVELTNQREFDRLSDVVSESFAWSTPAAPGGEVHGPDEAREVMEKIVDGFPDFEVEITDVLTSGDRGMAELLFTMTHEGEYEGIPPTGREVELRGTSKWHVADGEIEELRDCANMQELMAQLGVAQD